MIKIYRSINDTWKISNETLLGLKEYKPAHIIKGSHAFSNVYSVLRMAYSCGSTKDGRPPAYYFAYFICAFQTTADICISIKNTNFKFYFKNILSSSKTFYLPTDILNPENIMDRNIEVEINGMFYIERDEYPAIRRQNILTDGLLKNKDFDIIVIDGQKNEDKIQIHKEVFMAQSPAFEGMLKSGMEETQTNTLKIIDFNSDTVKLAVAFFYGQNLLNSTTFEDIFELYRFADKYIIDYLMNYITTLLSYRLTPSNMNELSKLANASTFIKLQKMCLDFITAYTENETDSIHIVFDSRK